MTGHAENVGNVTINEEQAGNVIDHTEPVGNGLMVLFRTRVRVE
jgi:hypothetical protein